MSDDPEQEYFSDGLTEDIITDLSLIPGLFVIARNSTFTYKGKSVDIRRLGQELGVRYVLEGSVRKSGKQVREILRMDPAYTIARYTTPNLYRNKKTMGKWAESLRKAGIPD